MSILQDPLHFLVIYSVPTRRAQGSLGDTKMVVKLPCFVRHFKVSCETALEPFEALYVSYCPFQVMSKTFRELLLCDRNCR
jgi:hypothetical protein